MKQPVGRPRGHCTICKHEERARAELLLAKGDGYTQTARKLSMSPDALERHWKRHVPEDHKAALAPGGRALAARAELTAQVAEEAGSVLDHLKAQRAGLWRLFVNELAAGRSTVVTLVSGQLTKINGTIARITGELATSPLVAITNNSLAVHYSQDPEFIRAMRHAAEALAPWPEARRAYFAALEALDRPEAGPLVLVPQLEHSSESESAPPIG